MLSNEFINEDIIQQIKSTNPIYVYVIGGSASGKNYWYENNLADIPLVDIDEFVKRLAKETGNDPRKLVSKGIALVNKELTDKFTNGISVGQTGTGGNTKGVYNRLKKAKDAGFETALILVDTDPEEAIARNQQRVQSGGHGDTLSDDKIRRTNEYARKTFNELKNSDVVTYAEKVTS